MNIVGYDLITVEGDYITADLIVWRRYRQVTRGVVEQLLEDNPHLARLNRSSPFIPVGTQVRIPLDPDLLKGIPQRKAIIKFWETVRGKTSVVSTS